MVSNGCHFLFLPEGLSIPLTSFSLTVALIFYTGIWTEKVLAMGASLVLIHGFRPLRVHKANTCAGIKESRRTKSKENIMDKFGRKKI